MTLRRASSLLALLAAAGASADPCMQPGRYLEANLGQSKLFLCGDQHLEGEFRIASGRRGAGKTSQGDHRTPVGRYPLGPPRASERFFEFIPVGYPTPLQRQAGYTGGDIGVHGPLRGLHWLRPLNVWLNWTEGCLAVGSPGEIREIADWVRRYHIQTLVIH